MYFRFFVKSTLFDNGKVFCVTVLGSFDPDAICVFDARALAADTLHV